MQHAVNIFGYGLTQLVTNLGAALRLTGLVWLLASAAIYALGYVMLGLPVGPLSIRPDAEGQMPALAASFTMASVVINLLAAAWVSMVWARFCLGVDTPSGWVPRLKGQPFGGVLITLILVVASIGAAAFILSLAGSLARPYMPVLVGLVGFPALMLWVLIWLALRLGSVLPASAQSEVMSLTAAWNGSGGLGVGLVAVLALMTVVILTVPGVFLSGLLIPGNLASTAASWVLLLVGTGWLVEIYRSGAGPRA